MKHRVILTLLAVALSLAMIGCNTHVIAARAEGFNELVSPEQRKAEMMARYGENKPITDGNYDRSLAVKCVNGTFVGKETDELIIWKGIPYATQPLGKLRWQKALPAADDKLHDGPSETFQILNGRMKRQSEKPRASLDAL